MALTVPDLRDDVVVLRPPCADDVDAITEACQDQEIPRFTRVPSPYARQDAVEWVERAARQWADGAETPFVILDAGSGALVGSIGVMRLTDPPDTAEVGYWVAAEERGRGVAGRALHLTSRWAVLELGVPRLELITSVDNAVSQRVAERAGFRREGVLRSYFTHGCERQDVTMFSLLPADLTGSPPA